MERSCNVKRGSERGLKKRFGEKTFTLGRWKGVVA
jgi:hypothetical protein